jgi:DNA-directed RNA polymerase I subunit RPA2
MRFLAHFRSVHRGAYFAEMKTTTVRKLLPDSWGYMCPVHTPDGAPCGLLNHLASKAQVCIGQEFGVLEARQFEKILFEIGVSSLGVQPIASKDDYTVILDGKVMGFVPKKAAKVVTDRLRQLKRKREEYKLLEVTLIEDNEYEVDPIYTGLFIYSNDSRLVREILHLKTGKSEWISNFEQPHLSIACLEEDVRNDTQY